MYSIIFSKSNFSLQIELFTLQILQKPPAMTSCGLFVIDKSMIFGVNYLVIILKTCELTYEISLQMVGSFATFLIILIQFELADNHLN